MKIDFFMSEAIVEARKNNLNVYRKQVYRIYEIMIGATAIVAIITMFSADWIVYILYGSIYQEASDDCRTGH